MIRTLSVGLINSSDINYINFCVNNADDMASFCSDLAYYIINKYSNSFLWTIVNSSYDTLSKNERHQIYEIAEHYFEKANSDKITFLKNYIEKNLYNYFVYEASDSIVLDGFARFRLKRFYEELEKVADYSADEYFRECEYKSFILMLKEFILLQKPLMRVVNIKVENSGRYFICDENFEELSKSYIAELEGIFESSDIFCEDDMLLSALISIAPKKIIIHCEYNIKNKQLFDTIKSVFENRVFVCNGCIFCK